MSNYPNDAQEPEHIPPSQNTPPPAYDQPANQYPHYAHPAINTPGQPSYNANNINPYEQIPYAYQQTRYQNPFPPSNPLPLGTAIRQLPAQYWRVLTHPRAATFDAEQGKAAWNIVWVQVIALAIISAILSSLGAVESSSLFGGLGNTSLHSLGLSPLGYGLYFLIGDPIGVFIGAGIFFLIAKSFQGQGTFLRYIYCFLLIYLPFTFISDVASFIPILGSLIGAAASIYEIVLIIFMTMSVHRLSGRRATLAVLFLPMILVALVVAGLIIAAIITTTSHS
jgi:hypothetical protein